MGIFGKKKEEEFEEDDELTVEDEKLDRRLTRKFKDLNSNSKTQSVSREPKRKEPPKPWGKKERLTVLAILLTTVLLSAVLTLSSKGFNFFTFINLTKSEPKFNLDNFKFLREETIEIRKK